MNLDIIEAHLTRLHQLPEAFKFYQWEVFPHDKPATTLRVKGCLADGIKSRGKRKGETKWAKGEDREFYLSLHEVDTLTAAWEKETGKCANCKGKGETIASAGVDIPTTYWQCWECKGTGKK